MKSETLDLLRRMEAERDAVVLESSERIIKDYLAVHPEGRPPIPMNKESFADFLAFTTAKATLTKLEKKYRKLAAASAAEELLKESEAEVLEEDPSSAKEEKGSGKPDAETEQTESSAADAVRRLSLTDRFSAAETDPSRESDGPEK